MKKLNKTFLLVITFVIVIFLYDIALEAIHNGYALGVDYSYEQGKHDVHVGLDPNRKYLE